MSCYTKKLNKDLKFGLKCEDDLLDNIREKWGDDIEKTNHYAVFDYISPLYQLELKSRRINKDRYPTTMIEMNKLLKAERDLEEKKSIFLFNFTDGCYYWEYNKEQYTTKFTGRRDRGRDERCVKGLIPITFLKPL